MSMVNEWINRIMIMMENVDCEVLLLEAETKDQTFTFCANRTLKKFLSFKKSVFYAYRDSLPAFSLNLFPSQYLPFSLSLFPTPFTFHPYIFLSFLLSFQLLYFPPSFLLSPPPLFSPSLVPPCNATWTLEAKETHCILTARGS